jgi:hypothetical protein
MAVVCWLAFLLSVQSAAIAFGILQSPDQPSELEVLDPDWWTDFEGAFLQLASPALRAAPPAYPIPQATQPGALELACTWQKASANRRFGASCSSAPHLAAAETRREPESCQAGLNHFNSRHRPGSNRCLWASPSTKASVC